MSDDINKAKSAILRNIPSIDSLLKIPKAIKWLKEYPRNLVLKALRDAVDTKRTELLSGEAHSVTLNSLISLANDRLTAHTSFSLRPVINATGIVIHTNLGRAPLCKSAIDNAAAIAAGYSTLEYDLKSGRRGKRYTHVQSILKDLTTAEDAFVVNNNAAAVFLCLIAIAKGKEVIISRGELVEIGGSFRIPDIMAHTGARLIEIGTTNKTHLYDYERAITDNTGVILKVHRSNFQITGFTEEVGIDEVTALARKSNITAMYDLGSGCLADLLPYRMHDEPVVKNIVKKGVDIITFSADKLLGGPQCGVIAGRHDLIEAVRTHPLARMVRVDKFAISALEATLMEYADADKSFKNIPVLKMLTEDIREIKKRAVRLASGIKGQTTGHMEVKMISDTSYAGGGSLPGHEFSTYAVVIKPEKQTVNELEARLRCSNPPVIARIKVDSLVLDARTIFDKEVKTIIDMSKSWCAT
ncbi:L-seryl-tRNA(Sec) selenium transferase [Candidatus Magnetominusculus xianensis]|uniref:L-seryl-tRNA(Sec) selenium transferase n=1 Tax=Candidatus Magnetominusculus xianensis TaxID=1748249 RepID=A0ABR5SGM0_9BACT|nr:L-seryl-tRNA(Sec) selenium transferase [Candidatus Magnetominusculus xianensis]KWT89823.1 L-selenocysteinyl-tRNA(Sec) synthase [Candidatus Magnetominusculus xianensis]MBF0404610.1 L-seryl-tRNA(Sec) selenium transferase [Nitrospirota bacterium]